MTFRGQWWEIQKQRGRQTFCISVVRISFYRVRQQASNPSRSWNEIASETLRDLCRLWSLVTSNWTSLFPFSLSLFLSLSLSFSLSLSLSILTSNPETDPSFSVFPAKWIFMKDVNNERDNFLMRSELLLFTGVCIWLSSLGGVLRAAKTLLLFTRVPSVHIVFTSFRRSRRCGNYRNGGKNPLISEKERQKSTWIVGDDIQRVLDFNLQSGYLRNYLRHSKNAFFSTLKGQQLGTVASVSLDRLFSQV